MFKRTIFILIILISSLLICSCSNQAKAETATIEPFYPEDLLDYTNVIGNTLKEDNIFKEEYGLHNLDSQIFYYSEGQYNFVINFNKEVQHSELEIFTDYFTNTFVKKQPKESGNCPYRSSLRNSVYNSKERPMNSLSLRVYIDNEKAYRNDYIFKGDLLQNAYYSENTYNARVFDLECSKSVTSFLRSCKDEGIESVVVKKSSGKSGVIIIETNTINPLSGRKIISLKGLIEYGLALELEEESILAKGTNNDYIGVILQCKSSNTTYDEFVYLNGEGLNKKWIDVNWGNFDFLNNYASH